MIETAKMSERGQIIIPKDIREEIHAKADTIFVISSIDRDTVVMKKLDTKSLSDQFQQLRARSKKISPKEIGEKIHAAKSK